MLRFNLSTFCIIVLPSARWYSHDPVFLSNSQFNLKLSLFQQRNSSGKHNEVLPRAKHYIAALMAIGMFTPVYAEEIDSEAGLVVTTEYEVTPSFMASKFLDPIMISGENFRVREEVGSDGYWDIYTVDTQYGVFVDSLVERGLEPVNIAVNVIQHPIETVSRIPRGIGQMFARMADG